MITLKTLFEKLNESYGDNVSIKFSFPSFYIVINNDSPEITDPASGIKLVADSISHLMSNNSEYKGLPSIDDCLSRNNCTLLIGNKDDIGQQYSFLEDEENVHWLSMFNSSNKKKKVELSPIRAIHFYGNKGGQARSTFLACLARYLADEGIRVLLVDADVEAPTLNHILGIKDVPAESSLMNLCNNLGIPPKPAVSSTIPGIGLISCRPSDSSWDADYISFCLKCSTYPHILSGGVHELKMLVNSSSESFNYDVVFFDHRTGVSQSVIPVINSWPGSCVIFSRPDSQTTWFDGLGELLKFHPENPGLFISFDMETNSSNRYMSVGEEILRENLLLQLSDAMSFMNDEPLSPEELEEFYIKLGYDRSFLKGGVPQISQLQGDNVKAIKNVCDILNIENIVKKSLDDISLVDVITPSVSGARDETWFVESDTTRLILNKDSNISYILGRKGTGKSRIFREAISTGVGIALIAPAEFDSNSKLVLSSDIYLRAIRLVLDNDYFTFWWCLIYCRIISKSDGDYKDNIISMSQRNATEIIEMTDPVKVIHLLKNNDKEIILLIDGLETIVDLKPAEIREFVASLLSCMATIHSNADFSRYLKIKAFLRMDLIVGTQNIEQQLEGRSIELSWNEQAQLNYNIACIAANTEISAIFPDVKEKINKLQSEIKSGRLETSKCESLLLEIFPEQLRRSNLKALTFLKTYFRDASSAMQEHKATFYPRLFLNFITQIGKRLSSSGSPCVDGNKKIENAIIMDAYEDAAMGFLSDVKQELYYALDLHDDFAENRANIDKLIGEFNSYKTPFSFDETVILLSTELGDSIPQQKIRDSLNRMKSMGIFEATAKDSDRWRAGRVYKSALKMKFVRR
ncbi:MinD/ParA family ATP-binding protein [Aeromonas hydrophila]|uniref:MinD/ParA family ATP-binding protein n=1 Tax=Aeromonas hydrophila TaxID=644 RepID=UPI002168AC36|nr:hypothetical protein [Aeromonas hydrophila]MCS3791947.1 hypothetical protein [Aeromonas hydrophila]